MYEPSVMGSVQKPWWPFSRLWRMAMGRWPSSTTRN